MLINVIEIADRIDSFRRDCLVVVLYARGQACLAKILSGLRADANQLGEPLVRRRRGLGFVGNDLRNQIVDLFCENFGELWVRSQSSRELIRQLSPQLCSFVIEVLVFSFGRHGKLPQLRLRH